jgi:hypothetical protein
MRLPKAALVPYALAVAGLTSGVTSKILAQCPSPASGAMVDHGCYTPACSYPDGCRDEECTGALGPAYTVGGCLVATACYASFAWWCTS